MKKNIQEKIITGGIILRRSCYSGVEVESRLFPIDAGHRRSFFNGGDVITCSILSLIAKMEAGYEKRIKFVPFRIGKLRR